MSCRIHWQGVLLTALVMAVGASAVVAESYWIAYEGDQFPEAVGWRRFFGNENGPLQGGAERSLREGVLTLDSMRHDQIFDFYEVQRRIDPGPGEVFIADWRVRIDPLSDPGDVGVVIARDEPPGHIYVEHAPDGILIEPGHEWIDLSPGVFHSFRVESTDMHAFKLFVDGKPTHSGSFDPVSLLSSLVNFGDGVQGARSLTHWDYFRFGTAPEPASALSLLLAAIVLGPRLRKPYPSRAV